MTNVLLFHGVTLRETPPNPIQNYNNKHIYKDIFIEFILGLKTFCNFYSINQLTDAWMSGMSLPANSCVVTFDDGFLNNYEVATPILSNLGIPATFYISTGNITRGSIFWVDQLEIAFASAYSSGTKLLLTPQISDQNQIVDMGALSVAQIVSILDCIKSKLKIIHPQERDYYINDILNQVDEKYFDNSRIDHDYRVMSWDQVREIDSNPLFTVGGHSVDHNIFSTMTPQEQEVEISTSIATLTDELGNFSGHYSYPEGKAKHFSTTTERLLQQYGVKCCPSAIHGVASQSDQTLFNFHRLMLGIDRAADSYIYNFIKQQ